MTHVAIDDSWDAHEFRRAADLPAGTVKRVPAADLLPVGRRASAAFRVVRAVAAVIFRVLFRVSVNGRGNVPGTAYVVITSWPIPAR